MAGIAVDGSPWVTGLQASGVVVATLTCTVIGASLAARAISRRALESGGNDFTAPTQRRRFTPEEYTASQQQQQPIERREEPEPLYDQQPGQDGE